MTRRRCSRLCLEGRSPKVRRSNTHNKVPTPLLEMRKCLGQLKRMVPTIEQHQKINQLELLQHVINYIQDLEVTLEYPASILHSVSPCRDTADNGHAVQT
ncbi:DNA-binding protein inhibitor ID-2-A [Paragonimus heterotremus]|uniref:DNA-binding protein inhibitor ID-2-A n=1 Tax=Paragonimus heterotremus TaxID=100268 RepID=A0A8J4WZ27_9TREM|nr:DNA-binding protein inhibitor ID-2-A [Paragonimus heterotremus]